MFILQASKFDIYVHYCTNKPKSTEVLMAAGDTYFQVGCQNNCDHQCLHYSCCFHYQITLRIARPRNALWRAILRRAILSTSFIRIARPIYFVFIVLICPSNSHMCCLEQFVWYLRKNLTKIDSIPKLINIDFDKIQRHEVLSFSLSLIKVDPRFMLSTYF